MRGSSPVDLQTHCHPAPHQQRALCLRSRSLRTPTKACAALQVNQLRQSPSRKNIPLLMKTIGNNRSRFPHLPPTVVGDGFDRAEPLGRIIPDQPSRLHYLACSRELFPPLPAGTGRPARQGLLQVSASTAGGGPSSKNIKQHPLGPVLWCVAIATLGAFSFGYHASIVNGPLGAIASELGFKGDAAKAGLVGLS